MGKRVQVSVGQNDTNDGSTIDHSESKYEIDRNRKYCLIDVIPMGAPRMTNSDRWKTNPNHPDPKKRQREVVTRYFAFKNLVVLQCNLTGYKMENCVDVLFCIPMPKSWSKKKKAAMNGLPHKQKPDVDNLVKGLMDALKKDDSDVWKLTAEKRWAYSGSIILFQ